MKAINFFFLGLLIISLVLIVISFGLINLKMFTIEKITVSIITPNIQMLAASEVVFLLAAAGYFLTNKCLEK